VEELSSYAEDLVERFRAKGVLVDTNLLLVYAIGKYDASILDRQSFNRVAAYTREDFDLLSRLLKLFAKTVTTAHVLTEVSNWVGMLPQQQEIACLRGFPQIFAEFFELPFDSLDLAKEDQFAYLGLADTAISKVAAEYLVLTDDARFVGHLGNLGLDALNINHIREQVWFPESFR
jgi:hypothetical protein